ncbi:heterokaryon incompatibility protein-domain-containing protein [Pisolithus orientalis]|uniref:heterokaryon incompatibility protein-domain-containing protein n=1 Tax=Pisolithus orientalis TaxID=936130 RepID=UPI002224DFDA|nr:heterokaryon incompatibility protein-domain-containing protein [Pisolithus orientalis]KAI6002318.1 heterokaryon incompatibility protein-domain-containing protein [Pisolithus orientalis]
MRLLDVNAFLDWERGIQQAGLKSKVLEQLNDKTTKYVILSHRWGTEVDYDEMTRLMKMNEQDKDEIRQRDGYQKIIKSCEQAMKDGYMWLWIDTCCIDKRSSTELSEAINSMYRWYRNSQMCYVYLNDVDDSVFPTKQDSSKFGLYNGWPEWFSRGWTLQELIAPGEVEFFNRNWVSIGTKQELASTLEDITRIPQKVLRDERVLRSTYSPERPLVAHILSWAADRKTTREEDRAYSLMGLFGVNMPMLYGERSKAFQRLQLEIIRVSSDHSIFAWNPKGRFDPLGGVLADDPSCFRGCHNIKNVEPKVFFKELEAYVRHDTFDVAVDWRILDLLRWGAESPQLFRFDVTNLGIQVLWPVTVDPDDPRYIEAILPCRDRYGNLITINMESHGLGYWRSRHPATRFPHAYPMFTPVYLDCSQDDDENFHDLRLHDKRASWNGFTRRSAFPLEVAGDTITFSSGNTLVVLVYANNDARSRFAVGLGYYLGNIWARVVCDECPAEQEVWSLWADFAEKVYDMLWNTPIDKSDFPSNFVTIKDAHVPRSNWDARIVYGGDYMDYTSMMIDIELCPGSCTGPRQCTSIADALWLPWASSRFGLHELELGGQSVRLDKCSGQEIVLGDYGDSSTCHDFRRCGNIFEDMQQHGIDPMTSIYRPVVSRVSSCKLVPRRVQTQHDAVTLSNRNYNLALYQPKGVSLPKNEEFELLLKAWSTRLSGKCLVTTVIQCSEFCHLDHEGRRIEVGDVSKGDNRLADPDIFTTLCVIGRPLAWHREPACTRRREQLSIIREHFYALTNLVSTPVSQTGSFRFI